MGGCAHAVISLHEPSVLNNYVGGCVICASNYVGGCAHIVICGGVCVCDAVVWGGCARRVCARHVWGVCVLRCIKARPESRTANVTYIKKYSILNIVIAHFVLS